MLAESQDRRSGRGVVREKRVGTAIDRIAPLPALPMHG